MNKKKLFMIVSIIVLIMIIIGGAATFAWYIWSTDETTETRIVTSMGTARVFYNGGEDITNAVLKPTANREEDGIVKNITVKTDKDTTYKISFNLYLDVISLDEGLKDVSFRYALYKEGQTEVVKEGNFSQSYLDGNLVTCTTNNTNHIVLVTDETVTTTVQKYTLYIWIDGVNYTNPSGMQDKTFNFKLHADGENAVLGQEQQEENFANYLTNLYMNASPAKSTVANNGINYYYAPSVSMMNDGMNERNVWEDGVNIGNIRYYGKNPNNYIDIGDTYKEITVINNMEKNAFLMTILGVQDEAGCHTTFDCDTNYSALANSFNLNFANAAECKQIFNYESIDEICGIETKQVGDPVLYRIIGLFKNVKLANGETSDLIKVIREDSIGNFAWDLKNSDGTGFENVWHNASLNNILNNGYLKSSSNITYYYRDTFTDTVLTETISFSNTDMVSIQNKIPDVVWNLGGYSKYAYSDEMYGYERGDDKFSDSTYETTWNGKVALAYPSDYGFAADLTSCSSTLFDYNNCQAVDWLFSMHNGVVMEWLLTPSNSYTDRGWANAGMSLSSYTSLYAGLGVRPTFFLDASLELISGNGTKARPYKVG